MLEAVEMYIIDCTEETILQFLKEHNEPYKSLKELPEEFYEYADIRKTQLWIEEQDDAEILEALLKAE